MRASLLPSSPVSLTTVHLRSPSWLPPIPGSGDHPGVRRERQPAKLAGSRLVRSRPPPPPPFGTEEEVIRSHRRSRGCRQRQEPGSRKVGGSPLFPVGGSSRWNTLAQPGPAVHLEVQLSQAGVVIMQSYLTPFLPNTAMAKQEMHSLFSNFAHVLGMSLENTIQGSQVTPKMEVLPVLFMKRSILVTGSAVLSIASRYRALLDRWILHRFAVSQGAPVQSAMILRSCWQRRFLPLFVGIGFLMARLYNYVTIHSHIHGRQVIHSVEANIQGDLVIENNGLYNQQSSLPSLLGSKPAYARLALQCIFSAAMLKAQLAPNAISFKARCLQKKHEIGALRSVVARNGQSLTYIAALVTLQMFLQLNRVNTTTSMLPMLFQTTVSRSNAALVGKLVIILVNSFGILGSAYTIKQHGRAATLTVGVVLMVFCQMAIPLILEFHTGLGGGSRMPRGYTAAMFVLTCVLSCGLSWSWGSMFWTVPAGKKFHSSAGQVAGVALNLAFCFAQMQYFLVMIWRLRSAVLAYYAMWIWS